MGQFLFSLWTAFLCLIVTVSSRVYKLEFSLGGAIDVPEFSVSLALSNSTTTKNSGTYVVPSLRSTHSYDFLLDDIGNIDKVMIWQKTASTNALCIDRISLDGDEMTSANRKFSCETPSAPTTTTSAGCQTITANFSSKTIELEEGCPTDMPGIAGVPGNQLQEYTVQVELNTASGPAFYEDIGVVLKGVAFDDYYTPFHSVSMDNINRQAHFDELKFSVVTYDVLPIESIQLVTRNTSVALCVDDVAITVTGNAVRSISPITLSRTQCVRHAGPPSDCSVLSVELRPGQPHKTATTVQVPCEIDSASWEENSNQRPSYSNYEIAFHVTDPTQDFVFYVIEGYTNQRTQCVKDRLLKPVDVRQRRLNLNNVGSPSKLYIIHDRNDNFCLEHISVLNTVENRSAVHDSGICSEFLYDPSETGRCSVITLDFETGSAVSSVSAECPWDELCSLVVEPPPPTTTTGSENSGNDIDEHELKIWQGVNLVFTGFVIILLTAFVLSVVFGYQCLWCSSLHACLIHCWDPFVDQTWNPRCGDKYAVCCHCSNTTEMQHNLCCYCCGCDYCNPFSIHRRRMDKKGSNKIGAERKRKRASGARRYGDEYDSEDGAVVDLATTNFVHKYDMDEMDDIDLSDHTEPRGTDPASKGMLPDDDNEHHHHDHANDHAEDQQKPKRQKKNKKKAKKRYSAIADAPMNSTGIYDDEEDHLVSGVVDHFDQ